MITIQYLEPGPHIAEISPQKAGDKLQAALALLPVDTLLLGWEIPAALEDICRNVAARAGTKLYRWHPLFTGDGTIYPEEEWRTRNLKGQPLPGFRGLPEFTFVCPNNPAARDVILTHISELAQSGRYEGILLDRMRFPSPAADPVNSLACFCEHCHQTAAKIGLDLAEIRQSLSDTGALNALGVLFGEKDCDATNLADFLEFRQHTITGFIQEAGSIIRSADLEVGLDCFSPSLTRMVGQNLSALAPLADWTKIMVYAHAFGPATLPFEFTDLANWLIEQKGFDERYALAKLTKFTSLSLPAQRVTLHKKGFPPEALAAEIILGQRRADSSQLLAGIELVEMPGVSELNAAQIEADLVAIKAAGADGLSISWDLWHIPLERLELVRAVWFS